MLKKSWPIKGMPMPIFSREGSMLIIVGSCRQCPWTWTWTSQPYLLDTPAGNILLAAAVLFAGATATKVLRVLKHLGVMAISLRTYLCHQREYIILTIMQTWYRHQDVEVAALQANGEPITVGGDGRLNSPGHSAKYGTYTLVDLDHGKILDIRTVQVINKAWPLGIFINGYDRLIWLDIVFDIQV